ncbi:MAG: hypothetical protein U9Q67_00965 [Patescibacteria group bacterium]|nr:hypothetical protein [Patescibacteria group bacterium]
MPNPTISRGPIIPEPRLWTLPREEKLTPEEVARREEIARQEEITRKIAQGKMLGALPQEVQDKIAENSEELTYLFIAAEFLGRMNYPRVAHTADATCHKLGQTLSSEEFDRNLIIETATLYQNIPVEKIIRFLHGTTASYIFFHNLPIIDQYSTHDPQQRVKDIKILLLSIPHSSQNPYKDLLLKIYSRFEYGIHHVQAAAQDEYAPTKHVSLHPKLSESMTPLQGILKQRTNSENLDDYLLPILLVMRNLAILRTILNLSEEEKATLFPPKEVQTPPAQPDPAN